jgi:YD repeat-containing protein
MPCPTCGADAVDDAASCVNCHPPPPPPPLRLPSRRRRRPSLIEWCLYGVLALLISSFVAVMADDIHNSGTGPHGGVYLVHLGEPSTIDLEPLRDYYQQALGLDVTILPPARLDPAAFDDERQQLVAERVIDVMRETAGSIADDTDAVVIGVVEQDMYIAEYDWAYALNFRTGERFAVVSTARMTESADAAPSEPGVVLSRLRKMVTKNLGVLLYRLPLSDDPASVFYSQIDGAAELDRIDDSFDRLQVAFHRVAPTEPVDVSYPCFVVSPLIEWDGQAPIDAHADRCTPGMRTDRHYDELEVDLRAGLLITRHTDFSRADSIPLVLTRASHGWDTLPRAFGVGSSHSYDIFPVGSRHPWTFVDLVMPDGAPLRFDRVSEGTDFTDAVYEHHGRTEFLGSVMRWNGSGWDMRFRDGGLFQFPEAYSATRGQQGALVGMQDAAGHRVAFERDPNRNLKRLVSPSGFFLSFEYDNEYRATQATDDEGRVVRYTYEDGRLVGVDDGTRYTRYKYDDGLLSSIAGNDGAPLVGVGYRNQRVAEIALADGRRVRFTQTDDSGNDTPMRVEMVDASGVQSSVEVPAR